MLKPNQYDALDAKPGDIKQMPDGKWRICLVGCFKTGHDEYETCLRWYLPKTGKDLRRVRNAIPSNHNEVFHGK